MPPRTLNAPIGVWFSCLTTTCVPERSASSGQACAAVGGTARPTISWARSSSLRSNIAVPRYSRDVRGRRYAPSPRVRGEGWGEGVQVNGWRLPLTRAIGATSPCKRGEVNRRRAGRLFDHARVLRYHHHSHTSALPLAKAASAVASSLASAGRSISLCALPEGII